MREPSLPLPNNEEVQGAVEASAEGCGAGSAKEEGSYPGGAREEEGTEATGGTRGKEEEGME